MVALMYLFLAAFLIAANIFMIKWQKEGLFPLGASGILLAFLGVVVGYTVGAIFVLAASDPWGGVLAAGMGRLIVYNGLIHFLIGLALIIGSYFSNKKTQT
ncbi:inner-membrane translocator [Halobacillus locisalis]|uniref:Inner-membrane translocator n=1 Tax=Halobacillus locisalis TaxID=220753 RepID=A0A838CVI4_9BACI|nr:inner-membrane translocator [Halobacillus locisalis]MBA2176152.1 inner-membrane translocator [Halobacillus locisalis]